MGGFKIEEEDKSISLNDFLIWEISDWIDGLSFLDDFKNAYNLEDYKLAYRVLDSVLQDLGHCTAVFAEHGYNENEVVVLITNDSAKYFIKVYGELDYNNDVINFDKIKDTDLESRAKQLLNSGYQELVYFNLEDEDCLIKYFYSDAPAGATSRQVARAA